MSFSSDHTLTIIETMENYIFRVRPSPEIRSKLDLGYEILDQSVILFEIRPRWRNPDEIIHIPYAKASFVKSKNLWKVYWIRADRKWYPYDPKLTVKKLQDFLNLVDQDKYHAFKG